MTMRPQLQPPLERMNGRRETPGERGRLAASERRQQLLETAAVEFAKTGLHGATTASLARAAGISEPTLYIYFPDKECLFKEVVRRDSDTRIEAMKTRVASLAPARAHQCIQQMVEVTMSLCFTPDVGPLLTNWALLELPEFAAEVHRSEIGLAAAIWQSKLFDCFPNSHCAPVLAGFVMACVQACYSYSLWLGALRHTDMTVSPLVKEFAVGASESARSLIRATRIQRNRWNAGPPPAPQSSNAPVVP
ncbi:MAG: TetR/AcrR family transcriptional regulator [Bryobacteraceae bacterium]|nr:TetR/AcrR family transcriptional regulator [Bryobacteraceae bacterium]